jgi:hypothetical protein
LTGRRAGSVAALLAATVAVLAAAVPAHAYSAAPAQPGPRQPIGAHALVSGQLAATQWHFLINYNSRMVLGIAGSSTANGARVIQFHTVFGLRDQAWTFTTDSAGYLVLRNAVTDPWKTLGISASSMLDGGKAISWDYRAGLHDQEWSYTNRDGDWFSLKNRNSGKCLAIPGSSTTESTQAVQWACNNGDDQKWALADWV